MTRFGAVRRWLARVTLALALAFVLAYTTSFVGLTSPNERSRLYLTVAIFEGNGYAIDQVRAHFGPVLDEARFAGHYFTDKAPGASLLALIPYAILRLFVGYGAVTLPMLLALGRYAVMVPFGIVSFFAFEALSGELGIGRKATRVASLGYILGTPAFHYSAAFFGHQIVGSLFVFTLWLLARQRSLSQTPALVHCLVAGVLAGLIGITEYQAGLVVVTLAVCVFVLSPRRRSKSLLLFVLGGIPFALWLAHYHLVCFGGPFELSYHHLSDPGLAAVHRQGIGGVSVPTRAGLLGALFSMHRGLFTGSPHLLLAPLGFAMFLRRSNVWLGLVLGATVVSYVAFVAGAATWEAGWGFGNRLLIPALPVLSLFVAVAVNSARKSNVIWGLTSSALLVSIASFQSVTALFAEPPIEMKNPWLDVVLPLGMRGLVAPNLGSRAVGLLGYSSLIPLAVVLGGFLILAIRAVVRSAQSLRFAQWLPLFPLVWGVIIALVGPSGSERDRKGFVDFVAGLYAHPNPRP